MDGGVGNDFLGSSSTVNVGTAADTLSGGEGTETSIVDLAAGDQGTLSSQGGMVEITNFSRAEDTIQIMTSTPDDSFYFGGLASIEDADGAFADIGATYVGTNKGVANTVSRVRVVGATGLTMSDVTLPVQDFGTQDFGTPGNDVLSRTGGLPQGRALTSLAGDDMMIF